MSSSMTTATARFPTSPTRSSPRRSALRRPPRRRWQGSAAHARQRPRPQAPQHFRPRVLASLEAALDAVPTRDDLVAVCLTGKPFIFSVGADLSVFRQLSCTSRSSRSVASAIAFSDARRRSQFRLLRSSTAQRWAAASRSRCTAPTAPCPPRPPAARAARGLPRSDPRMGRHRSAPRIAGLDNAVTVIRREPAQQQPDAQTGAGPRARSRRRTCRACRLHRAVTGLDRSRREERDHRGATHAHRRRGHPGDGSR